MAKRIENFDVMIGDLAIAKVSRNKQPFIEIAYTSNPDIRGLFDFNTYEYISGSIPEKDLEYVSERLKANVKYLLY